MSNPEAPMERPLVELPSGVVLDLAKVSWIGRKDLGKFVVVMQSTGLAPEITTADLDALREFGIIQKIAASEPQPDAENGENKIVVG